uniref:Uncharacterized protein n=1 Tax=Hippocampus comes TaxID=109280 RepID=A0A3Q2Z3M5_HIPCM
MQLCAIPTRPRRFPFCSPCGRRARSSALRSGGRTGLSPLFSSSGKLVLFRVEW